MNAWAEDLRIKNVKLIPDGSCEFTNGMGMLVAKDNLGFGQRSWRYAMVVDDGIVEKMFVEPGQEDDCGTDPYGESAPEKVLEYLKS
jgi:peroxiredoxin